MEEDHSLLDNVGGDASLANEWSLPVLPEDNSSHPSSSQELADIFGTSDDEEDVDFPFGLSTDLPVPKGFDDITLSSGNNKGFGNSLLSNDDSALFLAEFESSPKKEDAKVNKENSEEVKKETKESKESTEQKQSELQANKESDQQEADSAQAAPVKTEEPNTASEAPDEKEEPTTTVRKSARLRARHSGPESSGSSSEQEAPIAVKQEPVKQEPQQAEQKAEAEPEVKTEPEVNMKAEKEPTPAPQESSDESGSDEDSEEDDPDKLYCICRQPHDDRFMICCDACEDWFHGSCVGITVAQGKRMEREGREYVCPLCVEKQTRSKEEATASRSARQQQRELARDKVIKKKLAAHGLDSPIRRRRTVSGSAPTDEDGLSQLFMPDNAPRGGEVTSTSLEKANELLQYRCQVTDCPNKVTPPTIYCSNLCIEKYVADSLKKLTSRGVNVTSSPSEFVKGSGGITVVDKSTNKMLVGMSAPSEKELVPWLQAHPTYQIFIPSKGKKTKLKSSKSKVKHEVKKEKEEVRYPKIALMDPDAVRTNAKKALYQILWKRCEDAPDMSSISQSEVEAIAHDIEEKLFNLNQDINPKYKNKYRSLIFNLKDTKNQGLFRKVIHKEISSRELVRMSSEKLASDELSAWRESTLKKDIEMIKQREEEAGVLGEVIRKVTHKGEVEIDSSQIENKVIETMDTQEAPIKEEPATPETKPHSKTKPKSDSKPPETSTTSSGGILALLTNTTSEHSKHLYDQHCDICTGKIKPPTPSSPPPSPDSRMHEDMDTTENTEHTSPDSVAKPLSPVPAYDAHKVVWRGHVSMVRLTKFPSTAYPVSGYTDDLFELLPETLDVVGRIAYAQVWDYLDKIRSSSSREIVVIHFGWPEEERDAYTSMFNYLARKHRSGVIVSSGVNTVKDMYLVPLPGVWEVPRQLLPFSGPGLPMGRGDILLGVIVRSKTRKHSYQLNNASPVTRIKAEVTLKRHHSSTSDDHDHEPIHRKRSKIEIGFGGQTPPSSSRHRAETTAIKSEPVDDDDDSAPYSPSKMYEDSSFDTALNSAAGGSSNEVKKEELKSVQMSFYGEHQPANSASPVKAKPTEAPPAPVASLPDNVNTSAVADSLRTALNLPPSTNIQNILANLSSSKLKELASAVSNLEKISDGPIDQSTLAAAGTAKLRAALGSRGQSPSSSQAQPVSSSTSVPASGSPAVSNEPPVANEPSQQPSQQQFAPQPHQAHESQHHLPHGAQPHQPHGAQGPQSHQPHKTQNTHQTHESQPHGAPEPQPHQPHLHSAQEAQPQYRTEWDQRHQHPYHPEHPPAAHHPPQGGYPPHPPNNYPQQHDYHQTDHPPQPYQHDPSHHPPHGQYPAERGWRGDPRSDWEYHQREPRHEGWDRDERFHNRGRGFRGHGGHWDSGHHLEHGDRYRR